MALPQHLTYQEGGVISLDLATLPTAVTVAVLDGNGTAQMNHTSCNISTIDTTLAANTSKGATSFTVAANTGFSVGKTVHIQDDPEEALIRKIEGTTIYTRRPLMYAHVSGAAIEGARVDMNVPSSSANSLWWDGRASWNVDGETHYTAVECTKYPIDRSTFTQKLYDVEPKAYDILPPESDIDRFLDRGLEYVLKQIAKISPDLRTRVYTGSMEFNEATALASWYLFYRYRKGEEARMLAENYKQDLDSEIASICAVTPRDADQDGYIESDERVSARTVRVRRSG
jgi:hypothetical protein